MGLGNQQVRREKRRGLLLLLLQLGVLQEVEENKNTRGRRLQINWVEALHRLGEGLGWENTPVEGRGRALVSGNCHVLFLWDLEARVHSLTSSLSFMYSYPLFAFAGVPTLLPPAAAFIAGVPPQASPHKGPSDVR